jgi:hypothetical protein
VLITIVNLAILQPVLAVAMQGALPVGGELAGYARHRAVQTMCLVNNQAKNGRSRLPYKV